MRVDDSVTAVGFWIATVLPLAYFPVFLAGIDSVTSLSLFLGLLAINVLALIVGHEYPGTRS
ncbi:hypothetical protein [Natrarchaeobius oligotrophus]|uniref:Uncharacterized protein n=1 Tax=Natrarchaeobius chitinivorans TaxID=1679083 RepID=A0A3N6M9X5_NATCH|nr:hypothetical protein [Natrarchaeobius chitinivorans]RQH00519.1 hypothetical protein EA472_10705 [Natrarchaeobius chitinivorans]